MQNPVPPFPLPPEIITLANTYHLGSVRNHYGHAVRTTRQKVTQGVVGFIVSAIFLAIGIGDLVSSSQYSESTGSSGPGIIFLVLGLLFLGLTFYGISSAPEKRYSHLHVYVCDAGLIYLGNERIPQPVRWDQIQAVWRSVTRIIRNGVHVRTDHIYTVLRSDGYKFVLNDRIANIAVLGDQICNRVSAILLPLSIHAYQQGQTITFGSISINAQGISSGGNHLPWTQVEAIDVKSGFISVKRQGGWFRWTKEAAANIPNLFVFIALVDYILKQYGKR